jgi:hypothetical protein
VKATLAEQKSLNRNALRILTGMDVPKAYQPALNPDTPERDLALNRKQMQALRTHFQQHFKDPRRNNRSFPASSLLVMITMALLSEHHTFASIQRFYDVSGVKAGVEAFFSLFPFSFIVVRIRLCRRATGAGGGAGQRPAHRWGAFFLRCG